jgi:hypothetical protein
MRAALIVVVVLLLTGCASFDGRGLVPGQSTADEVERLMGPAADKRAGPGGESWLYYPRQPFGRKIFVARVAADGKLIALEQRLTDENVAKIVPQTARRDDVRNLLGPPYSVSSFPRMEREIWQYYMQHFGDPGIPVTLYVQFSPDGVAREVYLLDERPGRGGGRA